MKILLLTKNYEGLGLAHRLIQEGHDVTVYSPNEMLASQKRLFNTTNNLFETVKEVKFVIADTPDWRHIAKKIGFYNRPILGTNESLELANEDCVRQYELFKSFDIPTPESLVFNDAGEVFTKGFNWNPSKTVIRYGDRSIYCEYKDWFTWSLGQIPIGRKLLFQRQVLGVDTLLSGWFDGVKWLDSFGISPDLATDVYGYSTVTPIDKDSRLVQDTIYKLAPFLKSLEYHGPVNVNIIVDKMQTYAVSALFGFVYPLSYTMLEFVEDELGDFLLGVAYSGNFQPKLTKDLVGAVQCKCMANGLKGAPVIGINQERLKHAVFQKVYVSEENEVCLDTDKGECVVTVTAHGPNIKELASRLYNVAENIQFPNKHVDMSIASSSRTFSKLREWGHI